MAGKVPSARPGGRAHFTGTKTATGAFRVRYVDELLQTGGDNFGHHPFERLDHRPMTCHGSDDRIGVLDDVLLHPRGVALEPTPVTANHEFAVRQLELGLAEHTVDRRRSGGTSEVGLRHELRPGLVNLGNVTPGRES